jgi:Family of unknown function (DUF6603)
VTATQDSLGSIAVELGKVLEPLRTEVAPPHTKAFFAQIGIPLTDAQATALGGPIGDLAAKTDDLVTLIPDLVSALDAGDDATALLKAIQAAVDIGHVVSALDALATAAQGVAVPDAGVLAKRIFDDLLAHYLDAAHGLNDALELGGLLDRQDFNVGSLDPANPQYTVSTYHIDAIGEWLRGPSQKAQSLLGWGTGFDGSLLFPRLEKLLAETGMPVIYDPGVTPHRLDAVFLELTPTTAGSPGLVVRLKTPIQTGTQTIQLGPDAQLQVSAQFEPPFDTELTIGTDGAVTFTPPTAVSLNGDFGAKIVVRRGASPSPFLIFGVAGGSRLEFEEIDLSADAKVQWSGGAATGKLDTRAELNNGKIVVDTTSGDGFLAKILPGTHFEADFALLVGVSTDRGFYFSGSSALEVRLPAHIALGPVSIEGLTIAAALQDGHVPLSVGADIRALLGPLEAVVQNLGVTATLSFPPNNAGNLGPLQLDIGFKPPDGVGLRVDAGPIRGGGFLRIDLNKGQYFGALELTFEGVIALKAVGIINTRLPDGSKGFALLILVTAEFTPVQLGFGFTLIGVGGLLGLNRSLDTDALRQGVRTGSVNSVLFPPDVVGNITQIVSDLQSFFPIAQDHVVVAPMGKLGWGTPTLISLELGVVIDIPSPQLTILGVLRCILPEEEAPILRLQVNFVGGIDFQRGLIWFDASLFDSGLLTFTLSGDMALRIGWGDQPIFVITVGGFHPAFREVPPDLTGMKRLTIALLSGDNPRLVAQAYFAVTSNTVQSGARVELYAAACGFNIYGYLGYDLLIQFDPFHFVADISAGLALRIGDDAIAGIDVFCELSGPTPWHAKGDASFDILFFSISIGFEVTWGDDAPALPSDTVDVLSLVHDAVADGRNWHARLPANTSQSVTLRQVDPPADALLLHPFGVLGVSQKVAPLDFAINRFGNKKVAGDTTFALTWGAGASQELREEFAIANFVTLSDSDKLSRKSFEPMKSGLRFSASDGSTTGANVQKDVNYELSYVHRKRGVVIRAGLIPLLRSLFNTLTRGGAIADSPLSVAKRRAGGNGPAGVDVKDDDYHVVNVSNLDSHGTARTEAEAYALRDELVRSDPTLAGSVQVVAAHELATAGEA